MESGLLDEGDIQKVQSIASSRTGLKTPGLHCKNKEIIDTSISSQVELRWISPIIMSNFSKEAEFKCTVCILCGDKYANKTK